MKKRVFCVLLILVVCLNMPFFASAVNYLDSSEADHVNSLFDIAMANKPSNIPSNYKYYMVFHAQSWNGLIILFSSSSYTASYGGYFYLCTVSADGTVSTGRYLRHVANFGVGGGVILMQLSDTSYTPYVKVDQYASRYYNNLSTATFGGYSGDLDSLTYSTLPPPVDATALQSLITTAKAVQDTGYSVTSWQGLQAEIQAAETLLTTTGYTQTQIDTAKDNLQAALDALRLLPDASDLQSLVESAETLQQSEYTPETWQTLQSSISAAKSLLDGYDYTESQLDTAFENLQAAINGLEIPVDTSDIEPLVEEAEQIENIGFTAESWNRLQSAISAVRFLLSGSHTQLEIDSAYAELNSAMSGLILDNIPTKPDDGEYPAGHRPYIDGLAPADFLPVKDAVLANLEVSRKFGFSAYFIMMIPLIVAIIIRKTIGIHSEAREIDMRPATPKSKHYKGTIITQVNTGEKYIDW